MAKNAYMLKKLAKMLNNRDIEQSVTCNQRKHERINQNDQ